MSLKPIIFLISFIIYLSNSVHAADDDSVLHRYYNKTGRAFLHNPNGNKSNLDSAFFYLRKAVYLVDSANLSNNPRTNESLCLLAEAYFKANHFTEGKKIFLQVIKKNQQTGDKKKEADLWYRQGNFLLGMEVQYDDIDTSLSHASRLYQATANFHNKIDNDYDLAFFHFRLGKERLAAEELDNNVKLSRANGNYKLLFQLLLLAEVKRYGGAFNEALKYAMEGYKVALQTNDTANLHNVYGELALDYEEMNEPEKAVYWYKQCIKERLKNRGDGYAIYRTTYLMIAQMIKVKKDREGLAFLQELVKTNPPVGNYINAVLSHCFAYCYNSIGNYARAEKYFLQMIDVFDKEVENNDELFIANLDVCKFYVAQKKFNIAEPYLKKAFLHIEGPSIFRIMDLHLAAFKIDSASQKYLSAIEHFRKYKLISDSLYNEAKSKQIEELNVKYEVEKKEQNLTILQKENTLQQKSLRQEKITRNYILASVLLLLLIVGLLYNRYQLKQRANSQLEASRQKIEKQNISLQHLVKEKEWLLKEIHHRVKNNLHTISGLLDAQASYLQNKEALTAITDSQHRVQAMSLLHQKLFNSESLSNVQMQEYIHELVGYLEHSFGTQQAVKFNVDVDHLELGLSYALPIGLILNEAITNAIKYAFPGKQEGAVNVQLKRQAANHCLLLIADNGKGLPADFDPQQSNSMGMSLMQGLSDDINGVFSIHNNFGTEIKISFVCDVTTGDHDSFNSTLS